jgi:hypothetical protein
MAMEKYGVSDRRTLQEQELRTVKARLRSLRNSLEKTAADTEEVRQLEIREAELSTELASDGGVAQQ